MIAAPRPGDSERERPDRKRPDRKRPDLPWLVVTSGLAAAAVAVMVVPGPLGGGLRLQTLPQESRTAPSPAPARPRGTAPGGRALARRPAAGGGAAASAGSGAAPAGLAAPLTGRAVAAVPVAATVTQVTPGRGNGPARPAARPPVPAHVTAAAAGPDAIRVSWTAPLDRVTGFRVASGCPARCAAGSGTAGSGTPGSGTPGSGSAGSGTPGSGSAGSGTPGSGSAGSGAAGSGTPGSGAAGSGAAGSGTPASGSAGSGAAGSGTPASGSAGSGTPGSGTGTGGAGAVTRATGRVTSAVFAATPGSGGCFRVRAVSGDRASAWSGYACATTPGLVLPASGRWTDTGVATDAGDELGIAAAGLLTLPSGQAVSPAGDTTCTPSATGPAQAGVFPAPALPCWSLVGRIGAGPVFEVGTGTLATAAVSGHLYLAVNEPGGTAGTGGWTVDIQRGGLPAPPP